MLKNVLKVLVSNGVFSAAGLVISFLFPVILSTQDYAVYQEYILYVGYINICHLGIATGMFLNYAGKGYESIDKKQYKSEMYLILFTISTFTALGLFLCIFDTSDIFLLSILTIIPQCVIASYQSLFQAWERFTEYSIISTLPRILFIAIVLILFTFEHLDGGISIKVYLIIVWIIALVLLSGFIYSTWSTKSNRVFSRRNGITTWNGLLITAGNYVNLLIHSIDKQFVLSFFSRESFAIYSFSVSLQNVMMVFINALATPFYPRMAKDDLSEKQINRIKELLFAFGAYSGSAYFIVAFVVSKYIGNYSRSLLISARYFAVFPAVAVINVLYINLYKIRRMLKKYLGTLIGILVIAFVGNGMVVVLKGDSVGISIATMLCYYIWLFYSQKDFDEILINKRDIVFLLGFFAVYFLTVLNITNIVAGFVVYTLSITIWNLIVYRTSILYLIRIIKKSELHLGIRNDEKIC